MDPEPLEAALVLRRLQRQVEPLDIQVDADPLPVGWHSEPCSPRSRGQDPFWMLVLVGSRAASALGSLRTRCEYLSQVVESKRSAGSWACFQTPTECQSCSFFHSRRGCQHEGSCHWCHRHKLQNPDARMRRRGDVRNPRNAVRKA